MTSSSVHQRFSLASLRRAARFQIIIVSFLSPGLVLTTAPVVANPQGAVVVHGDVKFGGSASNLQITQGSSSAIINWDSFSINQNELTQFNQPNANSAVLNRVTGGDPSAIHGALKANGNVFVINPNGILVGPSGTIDVHGLVLSTLDVSNGEFLAKGDMVFKGNAQSGGVTNLGRINAIGGDVFLIGRTVSNSGSVSATGRVGLAAGEEVLLTASEGADGERMFVRAKGSGVSGTGIYNDGSIEGAAVELKAHGNVYALAINNKGSVRATGAVNRGGRVFLQAAGGAIHNSGSIRATSSGVGSGGRIQIAAAYAKVDGMIRAEGGSVKVAATQKAEIKGTVDVANTVGRGGDVIVEAPDIAVKGSTMDASGALGGGNIQIGGGFQGRDTTIVNADRVVIDDSSVLRADAIVSGSGGNVIVWSDSDTEFAGSLSAHGVDQGGFAEISGKSTLEVSGNIDLTADSGLAGTLLLDPTNITISATGASGLGGSTISNVWLSQQLDAGNNVVVSTNFGSGGTGNITVGRTDTTANARADSIQWYQNTAAVDGGTLTFLAMGNIYFNTAVQSAGKGGLNIVAGWDGSTGWSGAGTGGTGSIIFDMGAVLATMPGGANEAAADAAGLNGGSVFVGATAARLGVAVGSRWGETKVAAQDLILRGSTTIGHGWAQLGFNDNGVEYQLSRTQNGATLNEWWGSPLGNVQAKNYIALLGGTEFGTGDTNGLGNEAFRGAGWGATGDITVGLSGRLDARGGTTASYVQIGHGGILQDGSERKQGQNMNSTTDAAPQWLTATTRDNIVIAPGSTRYSIFSSTWRTNYAGDAARIDAAINITAAKDVLIMAAPGFDGVTDMLNTSTPSGSYAMIGHGGAENQGSYHGDISVVAYGVTSAPTTTVNNGLLGLGVQILGGRSTRSFAKIGHGSSYESNFRSIWDLTMSGDITVTAKTGAIRLQGHTQEIREGNLNTGTLLDYDDVTPAGNASDNSPLSSFVQIGHGGQVGALQVAGGTFIMPGGTNVINIAPDASMTGEINVFAGGTYLDPDNADSPIGILLRAGNRRWYHALIGHGGSSWNAINATAQTPNFGSGATLPFVTPVLAASTGYNGNISVTADQGSFIARGGDAFRSDRNWGYSYNYVQVGHGGDVARGKKGGTITVLAGQGTGATAGDILFTAGQMNRDHAMIGHGGMDSDGDILGAENTAKIIVKAYGDIRFESPVTIAHVSPLDYSTDYANSYFATPSGGTYEVNDRFVQIGHGGRANTTKISNRQDIYVESGTGDLKNADGDPNTGGVTFIAGDMDRNYALLGHGGHDNGEVGAITGDITVKANGGAIVFDASVPGGMRASSQSRSVDGIANKTIIEGYGAGIDAFAKLGHGGYGVRGVYTGSIIVDAWGGLSFLGAQAAPTVDRLVTNAAIDAALNAGTNVWVPLANLHDTAATVPSAYKMPDLVSNIVPGTVRIELSDGSVITDLPNNSSDDRKSGLYRNGVKIGVVDYDLALVQFDTTVKTSSGGSWTGTGASATFQTAQGLKERAFVQLGHGGYESDGPNNKANNLLSNFGDITIHAGGDIRFEAGSTHRNFAQLGHGGLDTKGASGGNIIIDHIDSTNPLGRVGGITFIAGHGGYRQYDYQSYAQLGHGGLEADGNHYGNIYIRGTQDANGMGLFFKAGDRQDASALLGHGGMNARSGTATVPYGLNGDIDIEVTGDVAFVAGTAVTPANPLHRDDGRLFAQLGHGGYDADAKSDATLAFGSNPTNPSLPVGTAGAGDGSWGHFGDIKLVTTGGDISFMAGSNIPVGNRYDNEGNPLPLSADPDGLLTSFGDGVGKIHYAILGHGGYSAGGDHHGNITVIAEQGNVQLVGGMMTNDDSADKYNFAQIGHGGAEAQGHLGRTTDTISVYAGKDVVVAAGNGRRNHALIGNGGYNFDGTHTGTIKVYAGRDVQLRGGMALERTVRRIGEFQDMLGANGGAANDIGEFNLYYGDGTDYSGVPGFGSNALGYKMMDEAAATGGGQKTKLMGKDIQPGSVEFRLAIAAPALFDANKTPEYRDDGAGNIIETANSSNIVGTIDYASGEITWTAAIVATNTPNQPDLFVNYAHVTGIRQDATYASAQIGHGGNNTNSRVETHPETAINGFVNRGHQGDIDVRAGVDRLGNFNGSGGSIIGIAGNDARTYVQIGHGGMDATAPSKHAYSANITTKADGSIVFQGGGGLVDNHYVGFNFYGTGSSEVTAVTAAYDADRLSLDYASPLDAGATRTDSGVSSIYYSYAMIGHGGAATNANNSYNNSTADPLNPSGDPTMGFHGDIFVETAKGDIDFSGGGGTGFYMYAQIGHGGVGTSGSHYGEIQVISGGDINFTAGGETYSGAVNEKRNYAMIGHGGFSMYGNMQGDITARADGAITFMGGSASHDPIRVPYAAHVYVLNQAGDQDQNHTNRSRSMFNFSQIGHGGEQVFGDKTGEIEVTAGNGIYFQGGDVLKNSDDKYNNDAAYANYAMIGHGGYRSVRQYRVNNTTPAMPAGAGYADDWNLPFWWDPIGNQYVFDGTFGPNGDGQFFWPSDNSIDPAKGIGNPLYDGFSGSITVIATGGDISFSGGTSMGTFTQIGHGGLETGGDHSGNITVKAEAGNVILNSNRVEGQGANTSAQYTFTHIGHGGAFSSGEQSGKIDVVASGMISLKGGNHDSFALIGHGGRESHSTGTTAWSGSVRHSMNYMYARNTMYRPGTRSGDISVVAGGDISLTGGNSLGDRAFVQIGHGGFQIHANPDPDSQFGDGHNGDIKVISAGGSILLQAGDRAYAHAMIGHGGTQSFGNHGGNGKDHRLKSDILVQAKTGIDVFASSRFDINSSAYDFAQIGHGGLQSSFRDAQDIDANNYAKLQPYSTTAPQYINPITGVVNVDDPGSHPLTPFTTNNDGLYLGEKLATLGTFMGDITLRTTDEGADIRFYAPNEEEGTLGINGSYSYVQLGHGGYKVFGDKVGDITVDSGGGIQFMALQGTPMPPNTVSNHQGAYALLGHGGYESGGSAVGDIDVTAHGDILFAGADSVTSANLGFAQLGHGGYDSSKAGAQYREAIRNPTVLQAAPAAPAAQSITDPNNRPIGNTGDITVTVLNGGNLEFLAGRDYNTYVQLGHGGRSTRDTHSGDITVTVDGGIRFLGGVDGPDLPGDNAGTNEEAYAQLGHGGYAAHGSHNGKIIVTAGTFAAGHKEAGRSIVFRSGDDIRNYTQIGHGGPETVGYGTLSNAIGFSGDITVTAASDILFVAGTISGRDLWDNNVGGMYTQIGHGGFNADIDANRAAVTGIFDADGKPVGFHGDITVKSGGSIEFLAGDVTRAYEPSTGDGDGAMHYAQIGHGGYSASGNHYGNITVKVGVGQDNEVIYPNARVYFAGGAPGIYSWADHKNYAQLGHGGSDASGDMGLRSGTTALNTIQVISGGDIHFTALGGGINSYVMLGNGGYGARGDHAMNIDVRAGGNVLFEAGAPDFSSASGSYNQYSWAGISATDSNTQTRSLDWAANLHVAQGSVPANPNPVGGVRGRVNISYSRVVPGTIKITIRSLATGTPVIGTLSDDGAGGLIADNNITADFGDGLGTRTITAGTRVADIAYSLTDTTTITFLQDVNPGLSDGTANLAIEFEHWTADRSFAQLGNGGYESDNPNSGTTTLGHFGNITVHAGEDVVFKAGKGASAYAHLGHGGYSAYGRNSGNINVGTADERIGGAVILMGGYGDYYNSGDAYVQIGHGGRLALGTDTGNISIYASQGGDPKYKDVGLLLQAGSRNNNYALIGHGGTSSKSGTANGAAGMEGNSGDITINTLGDVNVIGGVLNRGGSTQAQSLDDGNLYAQIGHGGYDADVSLDSVITYGNGIGHNGKITVISQLGSVNVLAGDHLRSFLPSPAPTVGIHDGWEVNGVTRMDAIAGGLYHYAMIGHGGYATNGNHWGDIDIRAGFNDAVIPVQTGNPSSAVRVWGGRFFSDSSDSQQFAQIGHGGRSASGDQGRVDDLTSVRAAGDIEVHGGNGIDNYAQIGNGGTGVRGDHSGDIYLSAGGDVSILGSQFDRADYAGQGLIGRYFHTSIANAGELNQNLDRAGLLLAVSGGQPAGRATFRAANGVIPGTVWFEIFNDAGTRIGTIEDDGHGALRVVSDFTELVGGAQLVAGQEVGSVNYAANWMEFTTRVNPGSQDGAGNVVVNFQHLATNRAYAMVGHGGYDSDNPNGGTSTNTTLYASAVTQGATGNISVFADGDVILKGGRGAQDWAQIGHGGMYTAGRVNGDIIVGSADHRIGGGVIMQGGTGEYYDTKISYVQIGHGGWYAQGTKSGDISIYAKSGIATEYEGIGLQVMAGTREDNYALVGHGGFSGRSGTGTGAAGMEGHDGDITVDVLGDVNVIGGVLDRGGATVAQFGDDGRLYAQIGHGGYDADATLDGATTYGSIGHHGDIKVISQLGSVNVLAGDHLRDILPSLAPTPGLYADYDYFGAKRMEAIAGGRFHWAQIGHGGYASNGNNYGDIVVMAGYDKDAGLTGTATDSNVRVEGGRYLSDQDQSQQYAQIGHGGRSALGNHGRDGEVISVMSAGNVEVTGGQGSNNYAQIGSGGYGSRGDRLGDIQILAGGDVKVTAAQFDRDQTVGNGIPVTYFYTDYTSAGALQYNLDRAGLLQTAAGSTYAAGQAAFTISSVEFIKGSVTFDIYNDSGVLIGTISDADGSGKLLVVSDFTELVGGAQLSAGQQVGTISYTSNQVIFTTRVNPGAPGAGSVVGGQAQITSSDPIPNVVVRFEHVSTAIAYAQIGHGGYDSDNPDGDTGVGDKGDIRISALNGDIIGLGGNSSDSYVQIGHGGHSTRGSNSGDVILRAGSDVVFMAGGQQDRANVQIGHGGWDSDGNHSGDVIVGAGSGALPTSLGTGIYNDLGDFDRDGTPDAIDFAPVSAGSGFVTLTGGASTDSWVQIGHGGRSSGNTSGSASTLKGQVGVEAYGDITLQGGSATRGFVQVGHGGWEDVMDMTLSGDISVISQTGKLSVLAGAGSEAYALIGHGSLRNSITAGPKGTRTGAMYIEADDFDISANGTTALARVGHTSNAANNGVTAGNNFTLVGNGGGGTTSYVVDSVGVSLFGVQDHVATGGDLTFAAMGDLLVDLPVSANSAGKINLLATGNLGVLRNVQNAGTGEVSAVAGWDGHTGMTGVLPSGELDFVTHVPARIFNIAPVIADEDSWGNNEGVVMIGDGTQTSAASVGSARGATTVLGHAVELHGSDVALHGFAQIGAIPGSGVSPTGSITVAAKEGGIDLEGGSLTNTYAQIGHRALGGAVPNLSGSISVDSAGKLLLHSGSGLLASSQIGHGGPGATVNSISGDITVTVEDDIEAIGGTGGSAYAQLGHGGSTTSGAMSGKVTVTTGGDLDLLAPNIDDAAYAKIGHGDDLRDSFAANGGTGTRDGAIVVSVDGDLTMEAAEIGHVGESSPAIEGAGATTWVGVSRRNPADPAGGSLTADSASQFGGTEVRVYLPQRENNKVAAGAWIAGTTYGGVKNPWPVQQADEYTNYILDLDGALSQPGEHDNSLGNGPAPVSGYAFYYDLLELAKAPPVPPTNPPTPPTPPTGGGTGSSPNYWQLLPDDWSYEDWVRYQGSRYNLPGLTNIYYEGFYQYGHNGESIYIFPGFEPNNDNDDDVLRRHARQLENTESPQESSAGGGE